MICIFVFFALPFASIRALEQPSECPASYMEERLLEKIVEINYKLQQTIERLDRIEDDKKNTSEFGLHIRFPQTSLLVQDIEINGWQLVFRATSGNGQPVYEAWTQGRGTCVEKPLSMDRSYACHYRHKNLANWSNLGIKYVKFALFENDREVAFVIFNGVGSSMNNWFSKTRVISSSYPDLTAADEFQGFSMEGHSTGIADRRFFILRGWGKDCSENLGHIAVLNSPKSICSYDRQPAYPKFIYSRTNSVDYFDKGLYGRADYLVVLVKTT